MVVGGSECDGHSAGTYAYHEFDATKGLFLPEHQKYDNLSIYLDNSEKESIVNRKNGIYKVYDNLFLNSGEVFNTYGSKHDRIDKFLLNLTQILEDLYDNDNNEYTVFSLYFIIKPDFKKNPEIWYLKINTTFF